MKDLKYIPVFYCLVILCIGVLFYSCAYQSEYESEVEEATPVLLDVHSALSSTTRFGVKEKFEPGDVMGLFLTKQGTGVVHANGSDVLSTYQQDGKWKQTFLLDSEN